MLKKVCHVTSVHRPIDKRIFERECTSLTKHYDVTLIAPNVDDYEQNGVHIKGVELPSNRFKRIRTLGLVFQKMMEVDADIYHFHDPELIPIGLRAKKIGKKVIFDSHENVPVQILNKSYIPCRNLVSRLYAFYEKIVFPRYDALVSVTPEIVDRLKKINPNTYMLTNYPVYVEDIPPRRWENKIVFAGTISPNWGIERIIEAISNLDVTLELAGLSSETYIEKLKTMPGWKKVRYHGKLKPTEVPNLLSQCVIGMALESYDNPNAGYRKGSIGVTKIYEYMMSGIPVIATDLENWIPIVEGNECGYCINRDDKGVIVEKINYLLEHPDVAKRLGDNGRRAVKEKYCWQEQEKELYKMYSNLLDQ